MRWSSYLLVLLLSFVGLNALFATVYMALGPDAIAGSANTGVDGTWWPCFFMSVHTMTGVGYGNVVPHGFAANLFMTFESFLGFVFVALATGVVFARFSRPQAAIKFSRQAIVAPYREGAGFMFRLAHARKNELINLRATVLMSLMEERDGVMKRNFHQLSLERDRVALFPLSWTVVHPMDQDSPFAGLTHEELRAQDVEILVMIEGVDETFSQPVYARTSYKADQIVWGAKFSNVFRRTSLGTPMGVDVSAIHDHEPAVVATP